MEAHADSPRLLPTTGYLKGPLFDGLLIIFSPLIALLLASAIADTWVTDTPLHGGDSLATIALGTLLSAHLIITFLRSHANTAVFETWPLRFTLVPLLLLVGMLTSTWFLVVVGIITTFWDEWHSGAQTFGLCRLYEVRAGNDPHAGRGLDLWMNMVIWFGPLLGGVTLMDHAYGLGEDFAGIAPTLLYAIPVYAGLWQRVITGLMVGVGVVSVVVYVGASVRRARRGHRVSPQKVALLVTTGLVSLYAWGFNSFGEAFFIMNIFHYAQYFGIVWLTERRTLMSRLRLPDTPPAVALALGVFLVGALSIGFILDRIPVTGSTSMAFFLLLSLVHFWYDGFIWSVRRKMV